MARVGTIDRYLPRADATESHEVSVHAPAELVFDVAENFDLQSLPILRAIFRAREALFGSRVRERTGPTGIVAETTALGWGVLSRTRGREIVMGAVAQPWLADVKFRAVEPERFADFIQPDHVRIVWTIEAEPRSEDRSILRTQTRARANDEQARRKFRRYWRWARAGIFPIRWLALPAIKREAERRYRAQTRS